MSAELGRSVTGSKGGGVGGESVEGCVGEKVLVSGVVTGKSCR